MFELMDRSAVSLGFMTSVLLQLRRMLHCLQTTQKGSKPDFAAQKTNGSSGEITWAREFRYLVTARILPMRSLVSGIDQSNTVDI